MGTKIPTECNRCDHTCKYPDFASPYFFSCQCYPGYHLQSDTFTCSLPDDEYFEPQKCSHSKIWNSFEFEGNCYAHATSFKTLKMAERHCQSFEQNGENIKAQLAKVTSRKMAWYFSMVAYDLPFFVNPEDKTGQSYQYFLVHGEEYHKEVTGLESGYVHVSNLSKLPDLLPRQWAMKKKNFKAS